MIGSLALGSAHAEVGNPSLAGRIYSNQFTFDAQGVPVVRVGLADGLESVTISSKADLILEPEGRGGATVDITGSRSVTIRVKEGVAAKVRYYVGVERVAAADPAALAGALSLWRSRGFKDVRALDRGAVFGFQGSVLDTRYVRIAVAGQAARADAEVVAQRIRREYDVRPAIAEVMEGLPTGTLVAVGSGLKVTSPGALRLRSTALLSIKSLVSSRLEGTNPTARRYRGALYVAVDQRGLLAVGNEVSAEAFVGGLVPAEIYPSSPPEALKAQAVAARNDVLSRLGVRHLADPYLVCDDVHCQVYPGAHKETPKTTAAVKATRGQVIFREDRLVDAVYSAACGGSTEDNNAIWPAPVDPVLRHRIDEGGAWDEDPLDLSTSAKVDAFLADQPRAIFCHGNRHHRWRRDIAARKLISDWSHGQLRDVQIRKRSSGGRVTTLALVGSKGEEEVVGELAIRRRLGGLKSTLFVLEIRRGPSGRVETLQISGGGYGHGVGMCQAGATARARNGQRYEEILGAYYRGVELKSIY